MVYSQKKCYIAMTQGSRCSGVAASRVLWGGRLWDSDLELPVPGPASDSDSELPVPGPASHGEPELLLPPAARSYCASHGYGGAAGRVSGSAARGPLRLRVMTWPCRGGSQASLSRSVAMAGGPGAAAASPGPDSESMSFE